MASNFSSLRKRQRRQSYQRVRDLDRQAKEWEKLSALEKARLEVEMHESFVEMLLSVHKEPREPWNWKELATALDPVPPQQYPHQALRAAQGAVLAAAGFPSYVKFDQVEAMRDAKRRDEQEYQDALRKYEHEKTAREVQRALARRILLGDEASFREALTEIDPLAEMSDLRVSARFTVHSVNLIECALRVKGTEIIPTDSKSLTATGKVSTRAMPKGRFHEIFQDYVCGSVLRVAREVFDLLPVNDVLVTALVDASEVGSERFERPVLSVVVPRAVLDTLDCEQVDPSDAMGHFIHRGDVKASRKTGTFVPIAPLTPADVPRQPDTSTLTGILSRVREFRQELKVQGDKLAGRHIESHIPGGEPA